MTVLVSIAKTADLKGQVQLGQGVDLQDRVQDTVKGTPPRPAIKFLSKSTDHRSGETSCRTEAFIGQTLGYSPLAGQTHYIGFGLWLPEYPYRNNMTIWQLRGYPEDTFRYFGMGFESDGRLKLTGSTSTNPPKSKWVNVLIRVKYSTTSGEVQVDFDGVKTFLGGGRPTLGTDGKGYTKFGIYRSATLPDCAVYFSGFKIATTRAEAEVVPTTPSPPPPPDPAVYLLNCPKCGTRFKSY